MKKNKAIIFLTVLIICSSTIPILAKEGFKKAQIKKEPYKIQLYLKKDQQNTIIPYNSEQYLISNKTFNEQYMKKHSNNIPSSKTNTLNNSTKTKLPVKHTVNQKSIKCTKTKQKNTLNTINQKKIMEAKSSTKKILNNSYDKYTFLISMCNNANKLLLDINEKSICSDCEIISVIYKNGKSYNYGKIKDPYYTLEDFESKLSNYFTKEYINNLENSRFFKKINNEPYFLVGQAGEKSAYHYKNIISIVSIKNSIKAKCNTEIPYLDNYKSNVTLKLEDGKWKIDSFDSILN